MARRRCPFLTHGKCKMKVAGLTNNKCPWFLITSRITREELSTARIVADKCQEIINGLQMPENEKVEIIKRIKTKFRQYELNAV